MSEKDTQPGRRRSVEAGGPMAFDDTVPLPRLGRSFDISLRFDQYAINSGLDDSLFVKASGRR